MGVRGHVLFWDATPEFPRKGWETTKNPSRYSRCPGTDSNRSSQEQIKIFTASSNILGDCIWDEEI